MARGVAAVWVPVADMKKAVSFYGDVLGLKVTQQDDDWTEIDANGLTIGLNGREDASGSSSGGAVISFRSDAIEDDVAELTGKGVAFTGGISDHQWGRIAPFKDPDDNDLQLYAPPSK